MEEEKCVYRIELGTPAVCGVEVRPAKKVADQEAGEKHDEL